MTEVKASFCSVTAFLGKLARMKKNSDLTRIVASWHQEGALLSETFRVEYIRICMYTYVFTYVYRYIHTQTYLYVYRYVYRTTNVTGKCRRTKSCRHRFKVFEAKVQMHINTYVYICMYTCVYLLMHLSVHPSIPPSIPSSIHASIHLSIHPPTHPPPIQPSIHLSLHQRAHPFILPCPLLSNLF